MIGAFGEVLVMDWGLAKVRVTSLEAGETEIATAVQPTQNSLRVTAQGSVLGTRGYMSPEQARGDIEVDRRTDIFSLGAILTFMLTGSVAGELPAASGSVPRPLRAISEKAMATDPNARYQSAREMTTDIKHYLNGEPVSAYPEGLLERSGRVFARHRTAVVLVAVYLIMRVLFILFARR
jgi:serine/threonine protein kinase